MMKKTMMKNHKSIKNDPKMEKLDTILEKLATRMANRPRKSMARRRTGSRRPLCSTLPGRWWK